MVMEQGIYSVYDIKCEAYLPPFVAPTDGVACRMVAANALVEGSDWNRFPGDYTLFRIGGWEADSGKLNQVSQHTLLGSVRKIRAEILIEAGQAEGADLALAEEA